MMNAADEFRHWETIRQYLLQALDMLSDEQLGFVAGEGLWSLGKVACHIAEAEDGWFRYAVLRELSEWPEFDVNDYPGVEEIKGLLTIVHARTVDYLAAVDVEDLNQVVSTPWGQDCSLREIVWHVVEHEAHHRGEIFLMLGLLGLRAPEI
jgi:uncharacterized damage-inducible protein DinB